MHSYGGPLQRRAFNTNPLSTSSRSTSSEGFRGDALHPVLLALVCFTANANGAHAKATRRPRAWISLERTAPQVGRPPAAPQRLRRQPSRRPDAAGHIGSFLLSLASPAGARALLAGWLGAVGLLAGHGGFSRGARGGGAEYGWCGGAMGKRPGPGSRAPPPAQGSQPHQSPVALVVSDCCGLFGPWDVS